MLKVGFLSVAHMHAYGYAHAIKANPQAHLVGIWDDNSQRGQAFAQSFETAFLSDHKQLLTLADAVVITSENTRHAEMAEWAAQFGKHILCEKPVVTSYQEAEQMKNAVEKAGVLFMTSFPCRYSPAFIRLKERVKNNDIGKVLAVCATNRGICPFDWFVDKQLSGGGAMMDHTVHVADLLRDLLQSEPVEVYAQTSNNIYGQDWEDVAMMHITFDNGIFATLDASWSRPKNYKTWGDVRMNVVGDKGVIELDMFAQAFDVYRDRYHVGTYGSDLDAALIGDFIQCVSARRQPPITLYDGLQASRLTIEAYRSAQTGEPVKIQNA